MVAARKRGEERLREFAFPGKCNADEFVLSLSLECVRFGISQM